MDKILDGKLVSSKIKEELINDIKNIDDTLTLAVLQVGNNEASNILYKSSPILVFFYRYTIYSNLFR